MKDDACCVMIPCKGGLLGKGCCGGGLCQLMIMQLPDSLTACRWSGIVMRLGCGYVMRADKCLGAGSQSERLLVCVSQACLQFCSAPGRAELLITGAGVSPDLAVA